jgi:peptidoglycan/LPS O-acetylase OafA/YrhL
LLVPSQVLRELIVFFTMPYMALWFAYVPAGRIRQFNKLGDYSYGVYIYASPVQLFLARQTDVTEPLLNLLYAVCVVVPVAVLSWHFIEKLALAMPCPAILQRLRLRVAAPPGGSGFHPARAGPDSMVKS